jgi:hypothetical protein
VKQPAGAMSELPRQIRLAAGDYFMHGQDCRMRQFGLPGNVCCAVMKLDQGFDVERLRRRLTESPIMDWLARVKILRPLPALFPPLWRASSKAKTIFFEHAGQDGESEAPWLLPKAVADRELHACRGPAVVLDVMRHKDGTSHLFISWNHTHLDARGLDFLLGHLNADPAATKAPGIPDFIAPKQRGVNISTWWPTVKKARNSLPWLHQSGAEPLFSLVPSKAGTEDRRNQYRAIYFSTEETARIDARCQKFNCAFKRSHFYLAASVRAIHNVAITRGNKDGAYLIPVPHDTRKRGAKGPIFSNHLSILFYRIEHKFAGTLSGILGELSRQMTDQIRDAFPESCIAALDMFKALPLGFYVNHLGKPTRGKFATFSFSDSGEACAGMTDFLGGKILEVTHLVPAWRPPGLTVVFLRFSNRLTALLSSVDDCLNPAEVDCMERDLRRSLLEEES